MNFSHWLVVLSVIISTIGSSAYIRDTLKGKTKPNRVSWFLFALAPIIGTAAAISADADIWATVRVFLAGFFPLLIFLSSFINPQSFWKLTLFDFMCGAFSLLAIVAWISMGAPRTAILLAAIADGFALLPTLRKAWLHPETETGIAYIASLASVLLVLPSIPVWNIENSAFQVYLLIANVALIISVYRKQLGLQLSRN